MGGTGHWRINIGLRFDKGRSAISITSMVIAVLAIIVVVASCCVVLTDDVPERLLGPDNRCAGAGKLLGGGTCGLIYVYLRYGRPHFPDIGQCSRITTRANYTPHSPYNLLGLFRMREKGLGDDQVNQEFYRFKIR